jgi:hypothetical protein
MHCSVETSGELGSVKKTALGLCLILTLIFSAAGLTLVDSAGGNAIPRKFLPQLTIKSDGSITPETGLISRDGNVYTLTADVEENAVTINCSNIVFNGAGHKIHVPAYFEDDALRVLANNVNVTNLDVTYSYTSILLAGSNCLFTNVKTQQKFYINTVGFNTVTESNLAKLYLRAGSSLISKCNISWLCVTHTSGLNVFTQNNFLCDNSADDRLIAVNSANFWDNGSVGNYWIDYLTRYPNASEIGNTGIGDTPYVLGADNVDRYPLMYPWGAPAVSVFSLENATYLGSFPLNFSLSKPAYWVGYSLDGNENVTVTGNTTLTGLSSGLHNVTVYMKDEFGNIGASKTAIFNIAEEPFAVVPVAAASVASVALIGVGLLVYFKKRNHAKMTDKVQ